MKLTQLSEVDERARRLERQHALNNDEESKAKLRSHTRRSGLSAPDFRDLPFQPYLTSHDTSGFRLDQPQPTGRHAVTLRWIPGPTRPDRPIVFRIVTGDPQSARAHAKQVEDWWAVVLIGRLNYVQDPPQELDTPHMNLNVNSTGSFNTKQVQDILDYLWERLGAPATINNRPT